MASCGMTRANEACRTKDRLWMAFAPKGHLRKRPLGRRVFDWERVENDIGLRAATLLLEIVEATFCAGRDCLRLPADDRREEARREDSSLVVIVAAFGSCCNMPC